MWNRKRNEIADLKATVEAARRDADRRVEEAAEEVREVAYRQYGDAASRVLFLQEAVTEQERVIDAQHRAVDHITGMTDPATRADLDQAGADYRTWRAKHGLVTCRVNKRAVAS